MGLILNTLVCWNFNFDFHPVKRFQSLGPGSTHLNVRGPLIHLQVWCIWTLAALHSRRVHHCSNTKECQKACTKKKHKFVTRERQRKLRENFKILTLEMWMGQSEKLKTHLHKKRRKLEWNNIHLWFLFNLYLYLFLP